MIRYYNMEGRQVTREEGWELLSDEGNEQRVVARDELPGDVTVSTVLLVIDHQYGDGPPLIFETMIFGLDDEGEYQTRCSTREQAELMHEQALEYARSKQ